MSYDPQITTEEAMTLYSYILDYMIMSADPKFETICKIKNHIAKVSDSNDREELKRYFESEFNRFGSHESAWDYFVTETLSIPSENKMSIREALESVVNECKDDYAVAYAKAALELGDSQSAEIVEDGARVGLIHAKTGKMMIGEELKVQILYVLSNLAYWRGEKAREVKLALKQACKMKG